MRETSWLGPAGVASGAVIGAIIAVPGFAPLAIMPAMFSAVCFVFYYLFADSDLKDKELDDGLLEAIWAFDRDPKHLRATTTSARSLNNPALTEGRDEGP